MTQAAFEIIRQKLSAELKALSDEDWQTAMLELNENLFSLSVVDDESILGPCPKHILALMILAEKKSELMEERKKLLDRLDYGDRLVRKGNLILKIREEISNLDYEHDTLVGSFWPQVKEHFQSGELGKITIRRDGIVVQLPPQAESLDREYPKMKRSLKELMAKLALFHQMELN